MGLETDVLGHQGSRRYVAFSGVWIFSRCFLMCSSELGVPLEYT